MKAEDWQLVKSLFDRVVDLSEKDRQAYLEKTCDQPHLIEEVNTLVDAATGKNQTTDQGLNTLVISGAHQLLFQKTGLDTGDQIGVYTVEKLIGQGGMGSVYLANRSDDQFQQKVAIKLSHQALDENQHSARFALERQLLGQLEHPNIARIFDSGNTADNCPFIIMEYIEGKNISEYCDNAKLSIEIRIKLFCQVCEAIQFAHQKGIIHRDLKPQNILIAEVDGIPVAKVIDFGIAENQLATQISQNSTYQSADANSAETAGALQSQPEDTDSFSRAGTPVYMSPEQIDHSSSLDTRSDVYALGVLLFVLMAGVSPFKLKNKDLAKLIELKKSSKLNLRDSLEKSQRKQTIAEARGNSVRQLSAKLNSELSAIVAKAMAPRPEQRYETATEFKADLVRFDQGLPLIAMPASRSYWLRKWISRHALAFGLGTIFIGGLMTATIVALNALINAQEARKLAESESANVQVINDYLSDMFAAVDPREKGQEVKVIDILEQAELDLKNKFDQQPLVRANLFKTFGQSRTGLGHFEKADELLQTALKIYQSELGEAHLDTLRTHNLIGELHGQRGNNDVALEIFERTLLSARKNLGPHHRLTMTLINNVAINSYFIANSNDDKATAAKSLSMMTELLTLRTELLGREHPETSHARNNLAGLQSAFDHHEEALARYLENHEIQVRIFGKDNYYTLATLSNIAYEYFALKNYDHTVDFATRSYQGLKRIQGKEHPSTVASAATLIDSLLITEQYELAQAILAELKVEFIEHPKRFSWLTKNGEAYAREFFNEPIPAGASQNKK